MKITKILIVSLILLLTIGAVSAADDNVTSDNLTVQQDTDGQNELAIENEEDIVGVSQNEILENGNNSTINYTYSIDIEPQLIKDPLGTGVVSRWWEINLPEDARGNVLVFINSTLAYNTTLNDYGSALIVIKDLNFNFTYDTYAVTVVYGGDNKYEGFVETHQVEIIYMSTRLEDNEVGDSEYYMLVDVSADVTGNITVIVNNKTYTVTAPNKADYVEVILDNLVYGENNYTVIYEGNGILPPKNITGISVLLPTIELPYYGNRYGTDFDARLVLPSDASGNFILTLDDVVYNTTLIDGEGYVFLGEVNAGIHYISAGYDGNDYIVNTTGKYFSVLPVKDKDGDPEYVTYGDVITLTANNDANANVSVYLYDDSLFDGDDWGIFLFNVSMTNGKAVIPINSSLDVGANTLIFEYHIENNTYNKTFYFYGILLSNSLVDGIDLEVSNCINIPSNITLNENKNISITFPSDIENNLIVYMDNSVVYNSTLPNGTTNITTKNLSVGRHTILVAYSGDSKYPAQNYTEEFTVNDIDRTFTELADKIEAAFGELKLTTNYIQSGNETAINIANNDLVIDGDGHTIDAKFKSGIFKITGSRVVLKNINFKNGNVAGSGGAINLCGDTCNVINCTFTNCSANNGGAINQYGVHDGIENCTFINCSAKKGGAIMIPTYDEWIRNCTFIDCYASEDGGAIYSDSPYISFYVSTFTNCHSNQNGGAICALNFDGSISSCNFTNCSADKGGAIYFSTSTDTCMVTGSDFINNTATSGRAIYDDSNLLQIKSSNFVDGSATTLSDVIYQGTITDCTLTGITTKDIDLETGLLKDANSTFKIGNPFNITVVVHNNGPNDATGAYVSLTLPPSIVVTSTNTLTGSYSNNGTTWDIGNLGADQTATLTITAYSIQSGNLAISSTVTALESDANSSNDMAQIQISVLDANTFEYLNALIEAAGDTLILTKDYYSTGNQIEISKSITIDGKSHTLDAKYLSRVLNIKSDGVTLKNIIFRNAFIAGVNNGGAINNGGYNGNIFNCSFVNCSAGQSAGAVGGYGDESIFANCSFINCSSADHSGAVDWTYDCNIFNSTFVNCYGRYGGAIACGWLGDNSLLYNCTFVNCSSSSSVDSGGAIWFVGSYLCNVVKCSFVNCSSKGEGGGIYFYGEGNISDSSFENCHASQGGALYFNNGGNGYNCNFTNCSADNNGGAVYWTGNNGKIESSNFIKCNAENGRAIYVSEGRTVNILKSKFDNADSIYGGTISNCTFGEKTNPDMTVTVSDITIGENLIVNVTMVNDSPQAVYLNIFKADTLVDWVHITASAFDGHADWEFSNLKIGEYLLNVEFIGDEKYESATCNMTFTVRPKVVVPEIVPEATNMNIYMDFGENITDTIVIKIDKKTFDVLNIKQGIVNESTKTVYFSTGNHIATFSYEGDLFDANLLNHMGSPIEYNIKIVPVEIPIEEEIETGTDGVFTIEVPITATGNLTIFIDGQAVQTLDVEEEIAKFLYETQGQVIDITVGILKIDLSKYKGKFTVTFEYSGDENFHAFTKEANVTVSNPSITATPTKALYTAGQTYTIKVYIATGILAGKEKVIVKVNGKSFKTLTTTNGIATFKITQTPGPYTLTITSLGKTIQKTLTVKHLLTLKTVSVKRSAKKLVLQATLAKVNGKYLKNKKVTFKFNGKKYTAKTNKKGVAKVTVKSSVLKKLKVGKKVTYQATYLKDTIKKTVKVKK